MVILVFSAFRFVLRFWHLLCPFLGTSGFKFIASTFLQLSTSCSTSFMLSVNLMWMLLGAGGREFPARGSPLKTGLASMPLDA